MEAVTACQEQNGEDSCWGYQLIIDCFGCSEEVCCDLNHGYEFLDQICAHLQMTKQTQPYIFKTCDRTFPGRPGYSGWVPIIESGIQIHTSANNRFVSVDVYSCKKFDAREVEGFVRRWFDPKALQIQFFHRGADLLRRSFPEGREAPGLPQEATLAEAG
jgi:S-adenosylmethionine decarboxylase